MAEAVASTALSAGAFIDRAEDELGALHGLPGQALLVSNGTAALELSLRALGIGPGDEVIVPAWAFMAAANMVLACGARPVFADVDDTTWLLDLDDVARRITPATRAIVAVHTYGNVCDMGALAALARARGLTLVEDCAESIFSRRDGILCGALGDVATFSFQATKTLTCGEGGLVLARDPGLVARMRLLRSHGMTPDRKYWHHVVGHNFRITNMQAAFLCAQIAHRDRACALRVHVYDRYRARLDGRAGLRLQAIPAAVAPVMWAVAVRIDPTVHSVARDTVMHRLAEEGIETRPGFCAASEQPLYATGPLGVAERIAAQVIALPAPPDLRDDEIDHVCARLLAALSPGGGA